MTLLVLENDDTLERSSVLKYVQKSWAGEVILFTGFRYKTDKEIYQAVMQADVIAVSTFFLSGSDTQFYNMQALLSKIPQQKQIWVHYTDFEDNPAFEKYIRDHLEPEEIYQIRQHEFYELIRDHDVEKNYKISKIDLSDIINAEQKKLDDLADDERKRKEHLATAQSRPTGRKIRILKIVAFSPAFDGLKPGQIVDEVKIDYPGIESESNALRGVWIWGNGEPVKLLKEPGADEYEMITEIKTVDEFITEVNSYCELPVMSTLQYEGLQSVVFNPNQPNMIKANIICEEFDLPKRTNRSQIAKTLSRVKIK